MLINDCLVGCIPAPACYQDFHGTVRFGHACVEKFPIDTKRIFLVVLGQSTGGHMVSQAPAADS
jgi:hypothetical protein